MPVDVRDDDLRVAARARVDRPELSRRYRAAMAEIASAEAWRATFDAADAGRDDGDPG